MKRPVIAAFDFDGTLTYRDTLLPFLLETTGWVKSLFYFFLELPVLVGYLIGACSRQATKERILTRFFSGIPESKMKAWGDEFARNQIAKHLRPEGMRRLKWHLDQGHRVILVSASVDLYLKPWTRAVGIHDLVSSRLGFHEGKATGKLQGLNCWGPEKVRRLQELLGDLKQYTLYAYGDSRGDKELLEAAEHPFYRKFDV